MPKLIEVDLTRPRIAVLAFSFFFLLYRLLYHLDNLLFFVALLIAVALPLAFIYPKQVLLIADKSGIKINYSYFSWDRVWIPVETSNFQLKWKDIKRADLSFGITPLCLDLKLADDRRIIVPSYHLGYRPLVQKVREHIKTDKCSYRLTFLAQEPFSHYVLSLFLVDGAIGTLLAFSYLSIFVTNPKPLILYFLFALMLFISMYAGVLLRLSLKNRLRKRA